MFPIVFFGRLHRRVAAAACTSPHSSSPSLCASSESWLLSSLGSPLGSHIAKTRFRTCGAEFFRIFFVRLDFRGRPSSWRSLRKRLVNSNSTCQNQIPKIYLSRTTALVLDSDSDSWIQDTIERKLAELVGADCCCISKRCDVLVHSRLKKSNQREGIQHYIS